MMNTTPILLDHLNSITLDPSDPPFNSYQAFAANYEVLKILAGTVREFEIQYGARDPHAAHVVLHMSSQVPELVPCAFMVAEAPVVLALSFVDTDRRQNARDYLFSSPLSLMCAVVAMLALGLLVGWLGHRFGLGQ